MGGGKGAEDETQIDRRTESTFLQQIAARAATITVLTGRTTLSMTHTVANERLFIHSARP